MERRERKPVLEAALPPENLIETFATYALTKRECSQRLRRNFRF